MRGGSIMGGRLTKIDRQNLMSARLPVDRLNSAEHLVQRPGQGRDERAAFGYVALDPPSEGAVR